MKLSPGVREALIAAWSELLKERPLFGVSIDGLGGGPGSRCWRIQEQHQDLLPGINPRRLLEEAVRLRQRATYYSRFPVQIDVVSDLYPAVLYLLARRALRQPYHHNTRRALRRFMHCLAEDYNIPTSAVDLLGALV